MLRTALSTFALAACTSFTPIDGSNVAPIGSQANPPSCAQACDRLVALCGMAPSACTLPDGGGVCDTQFDDTHLVCVGAARSCLDATQCSNAAVDADASAPNDGAAGDAPSDDAAADAPGD